MRWPPNNTQKHGISNSDNFDQLTDSLKLSPTKVISNIQFIEHKLIPARNASLAAMQGSASGNNVRYYPT
jgi:hypothetical protein